MDATLTKPFSNHELEKMLKIVMVRPDEPEEFSTVSIHDFMFEPKLESDLFVQLSDKRFLKIAEAGRKLNPTEIEGLLFRGLHQFYMKRSAS